ncbi:MAG: hypothetical protein AB7L94_38445 [Kofleriaceae bacterium]
MARLLQPRQDTSASDATDAIFARHGLAAEASALRIVFGAAGLGVESEDGDLDDDHEAHIAELARELREQAPPTAGIDVVVVLAIQLLHQRGWCGRVNQPALDAVAKVAMRDVLDVGDASRTFVDAFAAVQGGAAQLKEVVAAFLENGFLDPTRFLDPEAIRTTKKGTGGSWNQAARENDPRLPDYWFALNPFSALDAFRRLFEQEPINTLGRLALGLERSLMLQYPGQPISRSHAPREIEMRELYPSVDPLSQVLVRRRRAEADSNDRVLTRACWSYSRLAGPRAQEMLGEDYKPLADQALAELNDLRRHLREPAAEAFLRENSDFLTEAVFFCPRTDLSSFWPMLRRLLLAAREVRVRGVPRDLRTWDEHDASFERVPRPWNWVFDHIARVLELLLGPVLEQDPQLKELRRELAKFCIDRIKTREKVTDGATIGNESFVEPNPVWRAAYVNAVKELHPNLGERGHHALTWSRDHDPDEDVRDVARSAAEVIRHGHGLPTNTSPRRAVFAAFWWLRQAHVVSLGDQLDEEGALRTFRKEMRRQADLEK